MAKKKKELKELKTLEDLDKAGIEYEVIETISQKAQKVFWKEVASLCPEAKVDDVDSVTNVQFDMVCDNAIYKWRTDNDPTFKG